MKRYLLIITLCFLGLTAKSQTQYNIFMDSLGRTNISTLKTPQVAISGYYDNLLHQPSITIAGETHTVVNGATWSPTTSAPAITLLSSKTSNYTVTLSDFGSAKVVLVPVDATSGGVTVTLPTASTAGGYTAIVTKTDATANTVTVSGLNQDNIMSVRYSSKEALSNNSIWGNN